MSAAPSGRRARKHPLAKHPINYGTPMDCVSTQRSNRSGAVGIVRNKDHRGFQIWNGDLLGSSPEEVVAYIFSTTFVPPRPTAAATVDPLLLGIRDAADECSHGRLPGDRSAPCDCWGGS